MRWDEDSLVYGYVLDRTPEGDWWHLHFARSEGSYHCALLGSLVPGIADWRQSAKSPGSRWEGLRMTEERDWHAEPLEVLGLSVRPFNCLKFRGIQTVGQLCCMPIDKLLSGQSWGETTLKEARSKLAAYGLRLYDDWNDLPLTDLEMSPRALSLMQRLRISTVSELLAQSTEDILVTCWSTITTREVFRALGRRALRLRDGWQRGPHDWIEEVEQQAPADRLRD
jgi:DNA-directed RNA polymerase alpha subunit